MGDGECVCLLKQQGDLGEGGLTRAEAAGPRLSAHSSSLVSRVSNRLLIAPLFPSHRKPSSLCIPSCRAADLSRPPAKAETAPGRAAPWPAKPGPPHLDPADALGAVWDRGASGMVMLSGEGSRGQACPNLLPHPHPPQAQPLSE